MTGLLTDFFSSLIASYLIIKFNHVHSRFTSDSDLTGPQKFHQNIVSRIGGVSIALGLSLGILLNLQTTLEMHIGPLLLLSAIPTFAIGIAEDLTKKISVRKRLFVTAISAAIMTFLLEASVTRLDLPIFDLLLSIPILSAIFTVFAITGLANAYNIIDGFHGLSSMVGMITLLAIAYISYVISDPIILYLSLAMASAILGFFILNYPRGLIFLGDGGAYLIGFWIASLSVMLVARHQEISPWFALLVNAYPIVETLFTIYRRKIYQGKSPGQPDGIHIHTLIYRRLLKKSEQSHHWFSANAKTSPYLWLLTLLSIIPAVIWWQSTPILMAIFGLFITTYVWLYATIVRFRAPKWI